MLFAALGGTTLREDVPDRCCRYASDGATRSLGVLRARASGLKFHASRWREPRPSACARFFCDGYGLAPALTAMPAADVRQRPSVAPTSG
jgi:hypothetical protein